MSGGIDGLRPVSGWRTRARARHQFGYGTSLTFIRGGHPLVLLAWRIGAPYQACARVARWVA